MKWDQFRKSDNVEDYTDPNKPVSGTIFAPAVSFSEVVQLTRSELAKSAGLEDIKKDN